MEIAQLAEKNRKVAEIREVVSTLLDPAAFCETLLTFQGRPLRLYDYQKEILREIDFMSDHAVLQKARQIGASFCIACGLVFASFTNADANFLIVSRTWEQSGFIFAHVLDFYRSSTLLSAAVDWKRTTKLDLYLKNGTVIYHRTGGIKSMNLRGFSLSDRGCWITDETCYLDDAVVTTLLPMAQNCGIIHCSSPRNPSGFFYRACQPDSGYKHFHIRMRQCPRFSKLDIAKLKKTMSPSEYCREVMGEFSQGQAAVYEADSIERNIDDKRPGFDAAQRLRNKTGHNHIAAVDVSALQGDPIVMAIGDYDHSANHMEVIGLHVWAGRQHETSGMTAEFTDSPEYVISRICDYCKDFNIVKLYVDNTENDFFARTLLKRHTLPVETITWGNDRVKQRLVEHAATAFRADKITIPDDEELIRQLLTYSYDLKRNADSGQERTIYLSCVDDLHDAICMLCQQITDDADTWNDYIIAW